MRSRIAEDEMAELLTICLNGRNARKRKIYGSKDVMYLLRSIIKKKNICSVKPCREIGYSFIR